ASVRRPTPPNRRRPPPPAPPRRRPPPRPSRSSAPSRPSLGASGIAVLREFGSDGLGGSNPGERSSAEATNGAALEDAAAPTVRSAVDAHGEERPSHRPRSRRPARLGVRL